MKANRIKAAIAMLAMCGALGASHMAKPSVYMADSRPPTNLETMIPKSFGNWQVDETLPVILPAPDVQAKLNRIYNQVLSRTYIDDRGQRIMLSIAYGGDQSDGINIHLPEQCYPAQGFDILSRGKGELQLANGSIPYRRLVTRLNTRTEPVTYWIVLGDSVSASRNEQKLEQLSYGLRGQIPDGMLVRVSSIDRETQKAFDLHKTFITDLSTAVDTAYRPRVFGQGNS